MISYCRHVPVTSLRKVWCDRLVPVIFWNMILRDRLVLLTSYIILSHAMGMFLYDLRQACSLDFLLVILKQ